MAKYQVSVFHVARCVYEVEANSKEEAIKLAGSEEVNAKKVHEEIMPLRLDEWGMPFDLAKHQGIDVEQLRVEYNFDGNAEHIEGIEWVKEMKVSSTTERKPLFELRGVPVVHLSSRRIPVHEREPDLYYYEIRHSDSDWSYPSTIENSVSVNFYGTIVTSQPLPLKDSYLILDREECTLIWEYA